MWSMRLFPSKNKNSTSDKVVPYLIASLKWYNFKVPALQDTFHSMYDDGLVEIRFLLSKRWGNSKFNLRFLRAGKCPGSKANHPSYES